MTSSGTNTFIQHKVPRNDGTNLADYLLSNIDITAIAVDGGNRKWMGTSSNGVFLKSDDNNSQIAHFSTDNSPLISNNIIDITCTTSKGKIYDTVSADKMGEDIEIGFNHRFLLEALRYCEDENIKIELSNPRAACFIKPTENNDYIYMLLPVRLYND